ncbi:TUFT1 protein, partial [Vireo altiloquus]|nr:TUFT1 protein [Vireo altiloquus]
QEHRELLARMAEGQAELERLRKAEGAQAAQQDRSAQLEKEVATLREKIHHLDDMLKSQQRKVRQMIEQRKGAGRGAGRGSGISPLSWGSLPDPNPGLSQNLEMHDRIEHLIEQQVSRAGLSSRARSKSECVSR